jgi:chemotaxis protein methyltransferase CheR
MYDSDDIKNILNQELSDKQFKQLSEYIQANYGIKMPPEKKVMLQSRLQKRLKALKIKTFDAYITYVFSHEASDELIQMMDVVSTNKTEFYREISHFDILREKVLPTLYTQHKASSIDVWSAGSSSGQEAYTIAIELAEFASKNIGFDFNIIGSDISTSMLQKGATAIYKQSDIEIVPMAYKKKYFLKSKDPNKNEVRVVASLRSKAQFIRLNLVADSYNIRKKFDIIFCRNTLIYFNRETQIKVISNLINHLKPNGFIFFGHSESIAGMNLPLVQYQPTVFTKK